jgi:hypothetical protein
MRPSAVRMLFASRVGYYCRIYRRRESHGARSVPASFGKKEMEAWQLFLVLAEKVRSFNSVWNLHACALKEQVRMQKTLIGRFINLKI